jgi:hypothetical protein
MSDLLDESFRETGELTLEIHAKAREARAQGASRRSFFEKAGVIAAGSVLGVGGLPLMMPRSAQAATKSTDTIQDIINIAATAEMLATTFYYNALILPTNLPDVNSVQNRNYFQAADTQEYIHLEVLEGYGAKSLASKFYFPEKMFTDEATFFSTAETLEKYFISAYLAAAQEFSGAVSSAITTPNPTLIGLAIQVAGVECEHRALLRVAAGANPPNDEEIEYGLLKTVSEAVTPLKPFLMGGSGFIGPFAAPSKSAIDTQSTPYGFGFFKSVPID